MNKKYAKVQSTRRSLIMSIMSLMLCVTMLLGTTYAWFTDSVTSGTNRIVAGNLDVEMYYKNPNHLNWANVQTEDNADPEFFVAANGGDILWEPGVVAVTNFKVKNRGSLALKYDFKTVAIKYNTVKGTNRSLKDVIKFAVIDGTQTFASRDAALAAAAGEFGDFDTFTDSDSLNAGASKEFTVIAYWEPGVLNDDDYNLKNGLTSSDGTPLFVDIEIQLVATQNTAENDSFDNLYDELAELPAWSAEEISDEDKEKFEEQVDEEEKIVEIFTVQDLVLFAANINNYKNYTVELKNDIDLGGRRWTPITLAAGGVWNDTQSTLTINGNGHTISNLAISTGNNSGFIGYTSAAKITMSDLTFESPKISADNGSTGYGVAIGRLVGSAELTNVDVDNATIIGEISSETIRLGGLIGVVEVDDGNCKEVKLTDCDVTNSTIEGFHNVGGFIGTVQYAVNVSKITAMNCTVKNCTLFYGATAGVGAHAIANDGYTDVPIDGVTVENVTILGKIADGVVYDPAEPAYLISNANGLLWFADQVNTGTQTFGGKTVKLDADIDLKDVDWTPIGGNTMASYPGITFEGTFDGQNHTVSNLTCVSLEPNYATAGFFGSTTGAVKNLKLENVDITSSHYAGGIVAYSSSSGSNVENCHVAGGTITSAPEWLGTEYDNGDKAGGIFGYSGEGAPITGCSVKNLTIKAYRDIGGIAGRATGTLNTNRVENVTILQDNTNGYKTEAITTYGIFVGNGSTADTTNTSSNVKVLSNQKIVVTLEGGKDATAALAEAMATAADGNTIELPANESFKLPANMKNVTIKGDGTTKIDAVGTGSIASVTNGATFENMEFDFGVSNYHGFQHAGKITFKNCVLNGLFFSYGDMEFIDCTFNAPDKEYSMWLYGDDATFTGCTFNGTGKWFNVYNEGNGGPYNISFTDCKFVNSGDANKAAINVKDTCEDKKLKYNVTITNCTTEGSFPEARTGYIDNTLYVIDPLVQVDEIKDGDTNIRVVLDGEPVFPIPAN